MLEQPVINIVGEQVALGPLRRDLIPLYHRWINDLDVSRHVSPIPRPWSLEAQTKWIESQLVAENSTPFTMYEQSTLRPIGTVELREIDFKQRIAEFGILIGDADCRGKGYGTETTRLMLDYAFTALDLHNVMLKVFAYNLAGIRAYEKAGFREFGRRREVRRIGTTWWDLVYMDCLSSEFTSPLLSRIFMPDEPS